MSELETRPYGFFKVGDFLDEWISTTYPELLTEIDTLKMIRSEEFNKKYQSFILSQSSDDRAALRRYNWQVYYSGGGKNVCMCYTLLNCLSIEFAHLNDADDDDKQKTIVAQQFRQTIFKNAVDNSPFWWDKPASDKLTAMKRVESTEMLENPELRAFCDYYGINALVFAVSTSGTTPKMKTSKTAPSLQTAPSLKMLSELIALNESSYEPYILIYNGPAHFETLGVRTSTDGHFNFTLTKEEAEMINGTHNKPECNYSAIVDEIGIQVDGRHENRILFLGENGKNTVTDLKLEDWYILKVFNTSS